MLRLGFLFVALAVGTWVVFLQDVTFTSKLHTALAKATSAITSH